MLVEGGREIEVVEPDGAPLGPKAIYCCASPFSAIRVGVVWRGPAEGGVVGRAGTGRDTSQRIRSISQRDGLGPQSYLLQCHFSIDLGKYLRSAFFSVHSRYNSKRVSPSPGTLEIAIITPHQKGKPNPHP